MIKQKLEQLLKKAGFIYEPSHFYLHKVNTDTYYGLVYNHMGTGIHIPESEIDELECKENGICVCHTWKI